MNVQIQKETSTYTDGALTMNEKVYQAECPDCKYSKAKHIIRQLYTTGIQHDGYSVTIRCSKCHYHKWEWFGRDI